MVASAPSEWREILHSERFEGDAAVPSLCRVTPDAPGWRRALLGSRLHLVWIASIYGRLGHRYGCSISLGWHIFPAPAFTAAQLAGLRPGHAEDRAEREMRRPRTGAFPFGTRGTGQYPFEEPREIA